jgi:futalosine hydrolase
MSIILTCAATGGELDAFPRRDDSSPRHFVVSGVGIPATFAGLTHPAALPDLILNIGIAGAYPDTGIAIGDIVVADGEIYGDIGFELPDTDAFRSIVDSPFGDFYREPLPTVRPPAWSLADPTAVAFGVHVGRGCTVNSCTGTHATGVGRRDRFGVVFESMEGAAVAQIGQAWGVPVCEIRAISNIAGDRDMRLENIRLALANLRTYLEMCQKIDR